MRRDGLCARAPYNRGQQRIYDFRGHKKAGLTSAYQVAEDCTGEVAAILEDEPGATPTEDERNA